ncbi:MAG: hypothetical protein CM15mP71_4030 [Candidatus Poseidoniales archaeon]|nr:MAG: hypothetical protein CM15mP71_4030 [Candidatus Poseidoniales archaeon]
MKVHGFVEDPSSNILYFNYDKKFLRQAPGNGSVESPNRLVNFPPALGNFGYIQNLITKQIMEVGENLIGSRVILQ